MDKHLLPAWISAVVGVIALLAGGGAVGAYSSDQIGKLEKAVQILEIPGENPKTEAGFEFRLDSYSFDDRKVIVELLVTSLETDKQLTINRRSRLIDEDGHVYTPSDIHFGGKTGPYNNVKLPADIPVRLSLSFNNISSKTEGFKYLEIATSKPTITFPSGDFADLMLDR